MNKLNPKLEEEKKRIDAEAQKELDDYLKELQNMHVDYSAFKKMIDEYFFGLEEKHTTKIQH